MGRMMGYPLFVVVLTVVVTLLAIVGVYFPLLTARLFVVWIAMVLTTLVIAVAVIVGGILRLYHLARGRRDRSAGIPCIACKRTAFPVEGTTTRYHCVMCGNRFEGPEHF
jgi:hypothetical protein